MHRSGWVVGVIALVLALAACSTDERATSPAPSPAPSQIASEDCPPDGTEPVEPTRSTVPPDGTTTTTAAPEPDDGSYSTLDAAYVDVPPWPGDPPPPRADDGTWTVLYLGDSLAETTVCLLTAELPEWRVLDVSYGGTAPCDWVGHTRFVDALRSEPDLMVFSFLGNSITPCTAHAVGATLLEAYVRDVHALCEAATPARCVAVGQPTLAPTITRTLPAPDEPNATFFAHAFAGDWGFIDAGHAAETVSGEFDGLLRRTDGVHFNDAGAAATAARIADYLRRSVMSSTDR
jgi:hypothetical protein